MHIEQEGVRGPGQRPGTRSGGETMSTGTRGRMSHSGGHTNKASKRRLHHVLWAVVAVAALVMSACTPPDTGSANVAPTAVAGADVLTGSAPLTVTFSSAGSVDSDGTIAAYRWAFGDGQPNGTTANPVHTYAASGLYVATL